MSKHRVWILLTVLAFGIVQAQDSQLVMVKTQDFTDDELLRIYAMSPLPNQPLDNSNRFANQPEAIAFGEALFFDTRLSKHNDRSCASCHRTDLDWTDGKVTSHAGLFPKNTPSLWNVVFNRWHLWDGRADSLWAQAIHPLENEQDLAGNRLSVIHLIRTELRLEKQYAEIFGPLPKQLSDTIRFPIDASPKPKDIEHSLHLAWSAMSIDDQETVNRVFTNIAKAIAAFVGTIVVSDTQLDKFVQELHEQKQSKALGESAIRGLKLFVGNGQCTLCHSGPNLSDGEFHDLGIAIGKDSENTLRTNPGRHRGVLELLRSPFTKAGRFADAPSPNAPIHFLTQRGFQLGQFKTPQLRNISRTAPYMHDGRFATLREVVRFYSTREGVKLLSHPTNLLQPLNLSDREIDDLVVFLQSLDSVSIK